jgi:rhamnosyltransferase
MLIAHQMVSILIPTYNAGPLFRTLLDVVSRQQLHLFEVLVVDSSSTDTTVAIAQSYGARTHVIPQREFDHGGTRTYLGTLAKGDVLVYLTQDAIPIDEVAIPRLVSKLLEDERIGAAFGRQIPHKNATPFATHLREFNYPAQPHERTLQDRARYGMKTFFCSNSFAAYRRKALGSVGWFKTGLLMGEDMHACAKLLKEGYHIAYVADAAVYHSHNYSMSQEFKRYFDLGAFFRKEEWILQEFGAAEGEGMRFVRSELAFLLRSGLPHYIPLSFFRILAKGAGYRLGHFAPFLPRKIVQWASMHSK